MIESRAIQDNGKALRIYNEGTDSAVHDPKQQRGLLVAAGPDISTRSAVNDPEQCEDRLVATDPSMSTTKVLDIPDPGTSTRMILPCLTDLQMQQAKNRLHVLYRRVESR